MREGKEGKEVEKGNEGRVEEEEERRVKEGWVRKERREG